MAAKRWACNFYKPLGKLVQACATHRHAYGPHWIARAADRREFLKISKAFAALARKMHLSSNAKRQATKTQATQPTESL
jgi:hypothetical protein